MRAKLIRIGNSQGVRLPNGVVDQAELGHDLELTVENGAVIIRSAPGKREGWAEAAKACHQAWEDHNDDWDAVTADVDGEWR